MLGIPADRIGRRDSFLDRGGTSLSAVKLAVALDRAVTRRDLVSHPVLADLAELVDERTGTRAAPDPTDFPGTGEGPGDVVLALALGSGTPTLTSTGRRGGDMSCAATVGVIRPGSPGRTVARRLPDDGQVPVHDRDARTVTTTVEAGAGPVRLPADAAEPATRSESAERVRVAGGGPRACAPYRRNRAEATREASAPLVAGGLPPLENGGS
ncbi:acyl carrier protein [Geodermatophilus sp. URMC 65]